MASQSELKIKIEAQNTATPALTELLNSIKSLIEQARILNTLLNFHINASTGSGGLNTELHNLELQAQQLQARLNLQLNAQNNTGGTLSAVEAQALALQNHFNLQINAQNNAGSALHSATQSTQQLGIAANEATGGVRSLEQHAEILQTRLNQFIALQVAQVVTGWGKSLVQTAEAYQTNSARLKLAITDTQEFNTVHKELFEIAQRSRGSLDQTTNAFVRNSESIKRMGGTTEQALLATELLNKAIASTSMGAAQDASALMQWNQALGKGILNGDELNSIMENSLGLTKAIADGMGVPIGQLKNLGEQGKLTGTDLVNALFANKQAIETNFNTIPVTISQSLTAVENAFQKYIGEANQASGTTQKIGKTIMEVSKGIPEIVDGLLSLAAIYGVKLTSSLIGYIAQLRIQSVANADAIAEAERLNYVRIQELETQQAVAAASVTAQRAKVAEARLDAALAVSVADRTTANEALAASISQLTAAEQRYIGATAALGAATDTATVKLTAMQTVANGLKTAFSLLFAAWAGWEVGTFLRKFESVRDAGSIAVESFVILTESAKHFFSGDFLTSEQGLVDKIKAIHKDFADSRTQDSEDAQNAEQQAKTRHESELERVKSEAIAKKEAFKETQANLKEAGASIDAETARQTAAIKAELTQQMADVNDVTITKLEKELILTQAVKAANDTQEFIIKQSAQQKLDIINNVYNKQLATLKAGSVEQIAVEKDSLVARREVYQELEKSYQSWIDSAIAEEQKLVSNAITLTEQRKGIEESYADFKYKLHSLERNDYGKLLDDKVRLDQLVSAQKAAIAQGDSAEAERLNAKILELGKDLALKQKGMMIETQAEINKAHAAGLDKRHELYTRISQSDIDATLRITDKAQASILATNEKAQQSNSERFKEVENSATLARNELIDVQKKIEDITQTLQKDFSFKIKPDTQEVDDAINRIKQPTESTHTIHVIQDASTSLTSTSLSTSSTSANARGLSEAEAPPAYADGGVVYERKQGLVTGKGTGTSDEIYAMLSNGEGVLTAKATAKLGKKALEDANQGKVDLAPVKKYAEGGIVGDDKLQKKIAEIRDNKKKNVFAYFDNPKVQMAWSMYNGPGSGAGIADRDFIRLYSQERAKQYLSLNGLPLEWADEYFKRQDLIKQSQDENSNSIESRARAMLEIDKLQNASTPLSTSHSAAPSTATAATPAALPQTVLPPVLTAPPLPNIPPPNFSPVASSRPVQAVGTGMVSTVKFENQNGKTVTGHSQDPSFANFFNELNTVSGVTKT